MERRHRIAMMYNEAFASLGAHLTVPKVKSDRGSVWAQYTVLVKDRDGFANALKAKGVPTSVHYPSPLHWQPVYKDWKREFEKLPINTETILVGHSAGGAFLVRWLGENNQKIRKLILVAPGKKIGSYPNAEHNRELYDFKVNPKIKDRVGNIIIFTSPEEPPHRKENVKLYRELLGAEVISLKGKGHFVYQDTGTDKFPELLEIILS
jgi:predicted alpha/beta hydrolase family esterase